MRALMTTAAILGLAVATPAFAQSSSNSSSNTNSGTNGTATSAPAPGAMANDVKNDLEKAGFTDVQVMPSSFLVRAKDKSGRPVMMLINPDSVTEITNAPHGANGTSGTNGANGSNGSTTNK